jgi:hypothetical protein
MAVTEYTPIGGTASAYNPGEVNPYLNSHRASGMPNIGANTGSMPVTTTNISVWCNGSRVGVIKNFQVSESRTNTKLQELGTEGVVQIVPGNTKGGNLNIERIALYNSSIWNALGLTRTGEFIPKMSSMEAYSSADSVYHRPTNFTFSNPFKTLKDQRTAIEIQTRTQMQGTKNAFYIETYLDCWISSYSKSIAAETITVSEKVTAEYSDVIADYVTGDSYNVYSDSSYMKYVNGSSTTEEDEDEE